MPACFPVPSVRSFANTSPAPPDCGGVSPRKERDPPLIGAEKHTGVMTDTITLIGIVATTPRHLVTNAGLAITSFRLASTQRRFDRSQEKWVDADTNWYTVTAFRQLAYNTAVSVVKGDRVIVDGRIRIRDWQAGERSGTNIDVEADALGPDLSWGTARWVRSLRGDQSADDPRSAELSENGPGESSSTTVAEGDPAEVVHQAAPAPTPMTAVGASRSERKNRTAVSATFQGQEEIAVPF